MLRDAWTYVRTLAEWIAAAAIATLPRRHWSRWDLPVARATLLSALATIIIAAAIGGPAFLQYCQANADRATEVILQSTGWRRAAPGANVPSAERAAGAWSSSYLSFFLFFFTPAGLCSAYLAFSGTARAVALVGDDPRGDPLLGGLDAAGSRLVRRVSARRAARARERLEGPELPDRVLPGSAAGLPDADIVIVACRQKPGWERGVFVIAGEHWYRLGAPAERQLPGGLRTLYPLTELHDREVLRRAVRYDMPVRREEG